MMRLSFNVFLIFLRIYIYIGFSYHLLSYRGIFTGLTTAYSDALRGRLSSPVAALDSIHTVHVNVFFRPMSFVFGWSLFSDVLEPKGLKPVKIGGPASLNYLSPL